MTTEEKILRHLIKLADWANEFLEICNSDPDDAQDAVTNIAHDYSNAAFLRVLKQYPRLKRLGERLLSDDVEDATKIAVDELFKRIIHT